MRRFSLSLVALLYVLGLSAQPISEQEALQKARRFLQGKNMVSVGQAVGTRGSVKNTPYKHLYLFNVEESGGFVIVAGDSRAREILAYSDTGHLDYSQMPENMRWWLGTYDESIASIPEDYTAGKTRAGDTNKPDIAPMMSYSWSQRAPYNYYCPQGCAAGCIPVAMAQMMVFHKYPTNLPALDAYTDRNGNNLPALQANYMDYNDLSGYNPALLVRYCGQAVKASYGTTVTSAASHAIPSVLVNQFGFDQATQNLFRQSSDANTWDNVLYNELKEGRPFILGGQINGDLANGHSFICHGYSQGYYAVNWGWGGDQNGYFAMHALTTSNGDYSTLLAAVIGIRPPSGGTAKESFSSIKLEATSAKQVSRASSESSFTGIKLEWMNGNTLLQVTNYEFGVILSRPDGKTDILISSSADPFTPESYSTGNATISIGSQYGNGTYQLRLAYRKPGGEWYWCTGYDWRYVEAVISGNTLTLTNYPTYDAPYQAGAYPPYYPITPDDPSNPDGPDDPSNPDGPDDPDTPGIAWPETNVAIDYPVMKTSYEEGQYIQASIDWTTLMSLVESELGITPADFTKYYWADCYTDEDEVPAEDASLVIPYAYNYNWAGDYGMNMYPMLTFNLGDDFYGNGGEVPETGDEEPDYDDFVIVFCPEIEGATGPVISFQIPEEYADYLVDDETSPLSFIRWVRFVAKWDAQGKVAAPYHFVWVKLPLDISWGENPGETGVRVVETEESDGFYYDLRGQRVTDGTHRRASLKKGIYIHNGRKVVVR